MLAHYMTKTHPVLWPDVVSPMRLGPATLTSLHGRLSVRMRVDTTKGSDGVPSHLCEGNDNQGYVMSWGGNMF